LDIFKDLTQGREGAKMRRILLLIALHILPTLNFLNFVSVFSVSRWCANDLIIDGDLLRRKLNFL